MAQWHTTDSIRALWADAGKIADTVLTELLEIAKWQVLREGPELEDNNIPTIGYREAQHLQCRALVASRKGNAGADDGTIGLEGYQARRAHYSLNADIIKLLYPDKDWIG